MEYALAYQYQYKDISKCLILEIKIHSKYQCIYYVSMMKSQRVAAFCSILNGAIALPEYQYHTTSNVK